MKLTHTILYVKDVARAVQFYQAALGLTPGFVHESGDYAEMETGLTCLAFAAESLGHATLPGGFRAHDPAQPPVGTLLSFEVEDVAAAVAQAVAAGAA